MNNCAICIFLSVGIAQCWYHIHLWLNSPNNNLAASVQDTHSEVQALPNGTRSNNVNHSVMFVSLTVLWNVNIGFYSWII